MGLRVVVVVVVVVTVVFDGVNHIPKSTALVDLRNGNV
jgi:hypothetical protein